MIATLNPLDRPQRCLLPAIVVLFLGGFGVTRAQEVLMPAPEVSATPPAVLQYQSNQIQVFTATGEGREQPPPFQWGPVTLRPRLSYRFLYGDGLPSAQTSHVSSVVQGVSPGLLFGIGNHWILDYGPTWTFYSSKELRNTLDQHVRFTGGTAFEDWTFGLTQSYMSSSEPLIETGVQTDQEIFLTDLTASYQFNSKMSTDISLDQTVASAQNFSSYRQWSLLDWLNYQFWPRLDAGVGVSVGYVNSDDGPDMTFEGLQARTRWRATDKLSLEIHAGLEAREFLSGDAGTLVNPIAVGTLQYAPFEFTKLSINLDRTVSASYIQDQVTETTEINARLNQRLFGILFLDLSGGYSNIKYVSSLVGSSPREDNFVFFSTGLNCYFRKRGTAGMFYRYSDNHSNLPGFSLASNQVGFELGYRF